MNQNKQSADGRFVYRREIRFYETDMVGIVHFSNYFRLMEEAEIAFWRSRGVALFETWDGKTLSFPRVSAQCDFKSSARFGDELEVEVNVLRVGRSSVRFGFEMRNSERIVAIGEIVACCCEVREGHLPKPTAIPPAILKKLGPPEN